MNVETLDFPHCCTAMLLVNFGESFAAEGGPYRTDKKKMCTQIVRALINQHDEGGAVAVAMTNSEQATANELLAALGFRSSRWMGKKEHYDTTVKLWWFPIRRLKILPARIALTEVAIEPNVLKELSLRLKK